MKELKQNQNFLPQGYRVPDKSRQFLKLKPGENKIRFLSSPLIGSVVFNEEKKPIRKDFRMGEFTPDELKNINPKIDPDTNQPETPKHFWIALVWDYSENAPKVLEITQITILKTLYALTQDEDWGDLREFDVVINKSGSSKFDSYNIEWQLLNTLWFLPQNRERIYLVGHLAANGRSFEPIFSIGENDEVSNGKTRKENRECSSAKTRYSRTITARYHKMGSGDTYIKSPKIAGCLTGGGHSGGLHSDMTTIKVGTFRTHNDGKGFREVKSEVCPTIPARARKDGSGQPVIQQLPRGKNKGNDFEICPS